MASDPKQDVQGELRTLGKYLDKLQARLDEADYLSREEVKALTSRLSDLVGKAVIVATW